MLFGSISLAIVEGAPILGPDLESCRPVIPPTRTEDEAVDCCFLDTGKPIKDFEFNLDLPVRVRRPAHKLDEESVRKYERAVELMRALPAHDPRSFAAQSNLHCSYCAAAYSQFNSSETLDIHHCWLVLPWHRWYLYFHERILASLIGDDTFTIPYWAWDVQNESSPPANSMPSIFTNASSPLFDPFRSKLHQPPSRVDLSFFGRDTVNDGDPEKQKQVNFNVLWGAMVADVKTPEAFYGGKFSQGFPVEYKGVFEIGPHASVHAWTSDENRKLKEDMGQAYSSARDPIFFVHHSNVDRLWLMWKSFGGPDFDDQDWLDAEFLFYDENAEMVRVNLRDSLDADKLRISYEQVPADWVEYTPKSIRDTDPTYIHTGIVRQFWHQVLGWDVVRNTAMALGKLFVREERDPELVLEGIVGRAVVTSRVSLRPKITFQGNVSSSVYDEVIAVSGAVEKPYTVGVVLHMFLELPEANANTPGSCVEFLGSVIVDPEGLYDGEETTVVRKFTRTIGIGHRLRILGSAY